MEISSFHVDWKGQMVLKKTRDAVKWGIESTMADCVKTAMSEHSWKNRKFILQPSIAMRAAVDNGSSIVGTWGSFGVNYAIFLELGTFRIPKGKYTWLVPASEKHYPSLGHRIAGKLAWG